MKTKKKKNVLQRAVDYKALFPFPLALQVLRLTALIN